MSDSITLTVPMRRAALLRAADMFRGLAEDAEPSTGQTLPSCGASSTACDDQFASEPDDRHSGPAIEAKISAADGGTMPPAGLADETEDDAAPEQPPADADPAAVFGATITAAERGPNAPAEDAATDRAHAADLAADAPPGVEVDAAGLPWDNRIHASSKAKNKGDGKWRQKRGVDPELVATVEAELQATMSAGKSAPASAPAPAPSLPEVPAPSADIAAANPPAPPAPPAAPAPAPSAPEQPPAPPAAPAPAPANPALAFAPLMRKITAAQAAGQLTAEQAQAAAKNHGLPSLQSLIQRPDLVGAVEADIDAAIAAGA